MGYIIVIEGTDGCGKQTQTTKLYERLKNDGYNVLLQSFPNYKSAGCAPVKMYLGGEFGDSDKCLDSYQTSVLFAVDRLCTYNKDLKDFYENGGIIIFDRYVQSNMLHQAGKLDSTQEIDKFVSWLEDFEFNTLKLPRADEIFFLDVPVEISIRLIKERGILKAETEKDVQEGNIDHLLRAYQAGRYVSNKFGWNIIQCVKENKLREIDDISNEIYNKVISKMNKN